ncbi:hypothetical protein BJ742DRAFT_451376 [Cladochytrium replicatum]|nr:hypothetical protein BJ742DRAFT_451376 [Cladochytrium replicatum]
MFRASISRVLAALNWFLFLFTVGVGRVPCHRQSRSERWDGTKRSCADQRWFREHLCSQSILATPPVSSLVVWTPQFPAVWTYRALSIATVNMVDCFPSSRALRLRASLSDCGPTSHDL